MPLPDKPAVTEHDLTNAYRERAHLVAFLASIFPSVIAYNDPIAPEWPVIYVETSQGQMSWHLSGGDLDLFGHVPVAEGGQAPTWDGHSTADKYERLHALTAQNAQA